MWNEVFGDETSELNIALPRSTRQLLTNIKAAMGDSATYNQCILAMVYLLREPGENDQALGKRIRREIRQAKNKPPEGAENSSPPKWHLKETLPQGAN